MNLPRLLRTVRYLRGRQILGQLTHRVRRWTERPENFAHRFDAGDFPGTRWSPDLQSLPPGSQPNRAVDLISGRFCFLNQHADLGWPPRWETPQLPKLWSYNLHYFEYLWALDFADAKIVALDWIARHDLHPRSRRMGAVPDFIALAELVYILFRRHAAATADDPAFRQRLWASIALQTAWLGKHIESHLMGNHLLENAVTLFRVRKLFSAAISRISIDASANLCWLSRLTSRFCRTAGTSSARRCIWRVLPTRWQLH